MKVARVVAVFPPYRGGFATVAVSMAKLHAHMGHKVTVFTPDYGRIRGDFSQNEGYEVRWIKPLFRYGNAAFLPQLLWRVRDYDIVHLQYPFFGGAEMIWLLKKWRGGKMKLVLQYEMDVIGKGWLKTFFAWHTRYLMPRILKTADLIICSSFDYILHSHARQVFESIPSKFRELPLGVDTKQFYPMPRSSLLLERHHLSGKEKILLFVGGLDQAHYFKGLEYLLQALVHPLGQSAVQSMQEGEALKERYDIKLLVVGQRGDLELYYKDLVRQLRLEKHVIFVGTVSNKELPEYYNLCDVFVLPSIDRSEAFGLVYLEAFACKKPVIGADLPGVRSVIQDGIDGFLVSGRDVVALSVSIDALLSQPEMAFHFGERGREKVLQKYTWEKIAYELEMLYRGLL